MEDSLKHVLLFGSGSYDYHTPTNNSNYVPVYESRNSLSPLSTFASDDYYSLLEDNEGLWEEIFSENSTLDIGIGRLPIKSVEEAGIVVDKIIQYDLEKKAVGSWRKKILFVADDGDFNVHNSQANQLASEIDIFHPQFDTRKIYLDAFPQETKSFGQLSPETTKALKKEIDKGVLIANFTGHGSEHVWMQELVLDEETVDDWRNSLNHPLFITATCEFGRHDDPNQNSTGTAILTQTKNGAIGLVTSSRPVSSATNFNLNRAFYESLFDRPNGKHKDLGTIFRDTKNNSINGISNRNFSLLGDPSMHLALPEIEVVIEDISTESGSDTLKAFSKVIAIGSILENGNMVTSYNGVVELTLYDKEKSTQTLGDENPPFNYTEWSNAVFRGQAKIQNGNFQIEFILPEDIIPIVGNGKISAYAIDENGDNDATGSVENILVGGVEAMPEIETNVPSIELFMGDDTFIEGGIVSSTTQLVAHFEDESGMNIASTNALNQMTLILDDTLTFTINDYYVAEADNFRKGELTYPLENLEPGMHTITVNAWDVYNNQGTARIQFQVSDSDGLQIENFINYPNPFSTSTTVEFQHNRAGDDLDVMLTFSILPDKQRVNISSQSYQVHTGSH
ncbi:MAG: type IX secretion system sortase PorU [Flammeovirgaceae bacterium]|nr:type IX secretion system sortase PorU [Flammeovirgaceae bacterium]